MKFPLFSVITMLLFAGSNCTNNNVQKENEQKNQPVEEQLISTESYPSISREEMLVLWNNCDYIDYIFYYHDFSLSQEEKASIQAALNHVSADSPIIDPTCKPIGRIFYQVKGKNALEADIFFSDKCQFYLFYKDGKKAYANRLSNDGIVFYNNVLKNYGQYKSTN